MSAHIDSEELEALALGQSPRTFRGDALDLVLDVLLEVEKLADRLRAQGHGSVSSMLWARRAHGAKGSAREPAP